jgi:hypothetical protein
MSGVTKSIVISIHSPSNLKNGSSKVFGIGGNTLISPGSFEN